MEIDNKESATVDQSAGESLGSLLRVEREKKGLSCREVADTLRFMPYQIEALENESFEGFTAEIFIKSYLRKYGQLLGLDTDLLVALYEKNYRIEKPEPKISSISPVHVASNIRYLGVAAALLVLMLLWFLDSSRDKVSQISFVEDATIEPVVDSHHAIPVINSNLPANQSVVQSPQQEPAIDPVGDLDNRPDIADEIIPQVDLAIPEHVLKLVFSGDCWVEVKDAEGKTLLSALKRVGDKVELDGIAPFNVLLGYAPVVTVSYNDEPIAIDINPRSQAARLVVGSL